MPRSRSQFEFAGIASTGPLPAAASPAFGRGRAAFASQPQSDGASSGAQMHVPPSATEDNQDNTGGGFMSYIMSAVRALGGTESATIHQADLLYASCEQQALLSCAQEKLDLPKTFMSEHFLVAMHVWIVQRCLLRPELETSLPWVSISEVVKTPSSHTHSLTSRPPSAEPPPGFTPSALDKLALKHAYDKEYCQDVQQMMFDTFWEDSKRKLRGSGVLELSINKYLLQVQEATFSAMCSWDESLRLASEADAALAAGSVGADEHAKLVAEADDIMDGAIWRSLLQRQESERAGAAAVEVREYMKAELGRVRDLDRGALVLGRVAWGSPLAGFDTSLGKLPDEGGGG